MCTFYGGKFRKRNGIHDIHGDICDFSFNIGDPLFCQNHIPYTIRHQETSNFATKCQAEATLICDSESVQFYGRCYKMKRKLVKFKEAEMSCHLDGERIAFVHREVLIKFWNEYFSSVDRIWALSSNILTSDLIYDKGNDLIIAFDGYRYNLPPRSLVKVDGTKEKAFALCEYNPKMTTAHLRFLGKKYSEIYYPSISIDDGLFVRTFSQRQWSGDKKNDDDYCKRVFQAFLLLEGVTVVAARPSKSFLRELPEYNEPWYTFYRTPMHYSNKKMDFKNPECQEDPNPIEKFGSIEPEIWAEDQPVLTCDSASASTVIRMKDEGLEGQLETFSDARYAPMFCQVTVNH